MEEKIEIIKNNIDELPEKIINKIYELYENNKENYSDSESDEDEDEDIKEKQERLFLKFLNRVLINLDKKKIETITDFKKIDREDVINQEDIFKKMENKFYKYFDKVEIGWYKRNQIQNYSLTVFKKVIEILGSY